MNSRGQDGVAILAPIRSMRWVQSSSPITTLPVLAAELGLQGVYVKRDDLLPALAGGAKARKLDYLLASAPFEGAPGYHGIGAIGSGLLVSLATACRLLNKTLHAHVFDEPIDDHVLDNLAATVSAAQSVHFAKSRVGLFLKRPAIFQKPIVANLPVVPPGATNAAGMVGMVRAGLELGDQIRAGVLPEPARVYVPLGSGGAAVGLAVGFALMRIPTKVHAVAVVERAYSSEARLTELTRDLLAHLTRAGISGTSALKPVQIVIDRAHLGKGYGYPSEESSTAVRRLERSGMFLESVYGGKAMAALMTDATSIGKRPVLFWHTRRGAMPPIRGDWQARLPEPLRRRVQPR